VIDVRITTKLFDKETSKKVNKLVQKHFVICETTNIIDILAKRSNVHFVPKSVCLNVVNGVQINILCLTYRDKTEYFLYFKHNSIDTCDLYYKVQILSSLEEVKNEFSVLTDTMLNLFNYKK